MLIYSCILQKQGLPPNQSLFASSKWIGS